ncbi:hypothetical protein [Brachybacterium phenoliresistens]|uniref:hypothetical protein n=1 Tax=Brachybacterium phenoliresistens TaxID=396014 RepID=UPI0031E3CD9A
MTDRPAPRPSAAPGPAPRMRRTLEIVLVCLGIAGSLVLMGGFTLVINTIDQATFAEAVMPSLVGESADAAEAYASARTLAAWFGISLVVLLLVSAAGLALTRMRPHRRSTGLLFLVAGLVCLLGSQLVLFPIAFLFFAAAALFALRPVPEGSLR